MKIAETHARYGTTAMVPTTFIRNPDAKEYMDVISHSNAIVRWSAAPNYRASSHLPDIFNQKNITGISAYIFGL